MVYVDTGFISAFMRDFTGSLVLDYIGPVPLQYVYGSVKSSIHGSFPWISEETAAISSLCGNPMFFRNPTAIPEFIFGVDTL